MSFDNKTTIQIYRVDEVNSKKVILPVMQSISAGFPSPAVDFEEEVIDLHALLIEHPSATFFGRVSGNSLQNIGIFNESILVIDKSIEPKNKHIAVCYIDGEFTAKRINLHDGELWLLPENNDYKPIKITKDSNFQVWGVVTWGLNKYV